MAGIRKKVIPTALKAKLGKAHAYPVGAMAVSVKLHGVPQYDDLRAWFSQPAHAPSLVLAARYTFPGNDFSLPLSLRSSLYSHPQWDITVYAVPREVSYKVKGHLNQSGLVWVRDWLATKRTETWLQTSQRLEIHYDSELDALRAE